jgi:hypothetical protein
LLLRISSVSGNIPNPGSTINKLATKRGIDLKTEILPRISCVKQQVNIQEFW